MGFRPQAWARVNATARGDNWVDFYGFQDQYSLGLSRQRLAVVFPSLSGGLEPGVEERMVVTESATSGTCKASSTCPLYPSWFVACARKVEARTHTRFVTVLVPHTNHGPGAGAKIAASVLATYSNSYRNSSSGSGNGGHSSGSGADATSITVSLRTNGTATVLRAELASVDMAADSPELAWSVERN